MKVKRKTVIKWLAKVAQSIPEKTYKAYHKFYKPQIEYVPVENTAIGGEESEEAKEEQKMEPVLRFGYLADHSVNHKRRMLHLWDKDGVAGVEGYLRQFDLTLFPVTAKETAD